MKVKLVSDGRVFDGESAIYEPGDVAWFEEDVLLVTEIRVSVALAIEHPAAAEMMKAALNVGKDGRAGFEEAMRIHARTMVRWAARAQPVVFADATRIFADGVTALTLLTRGDPAKVDRVAAEEKVVDALTRLARLDLAMGSIPETLTREAAADYASYLSPAARRMIDLNNPRACAASFESLITGPPDVLRAREIVRAHVRWIDAKASEARTS